VETAKWLFLQMRPAQWTKNALVFAALVFSADKVGLQEIVRSTAAFVLFSLVSGCVYILNDFVDREADRLHPEKRHRPMASGRLRPATALAFGAAVLALSIAAAFAADAAFGTVLTVYFALNVAYSLWLKHEVILDIMLVAAGFVLRALGGVLAIGLPFTPWFLFCVFVLSLLLAIGKRRHEWLLLRGGRGEHRKVLERYTETLLDQLLVVAATAAILSYGLFTFLSGRSVHLMWTVPIVIYGVFRYLYLVYALGEGGKPEELVFQDRGMVAAMLLFGVTVVVVLIWF